MTFEGIEAHGLQKWLEGLIKELRGKTYKPSSVRQEMITKPDEGERPVGIFTIRDRVVQTAVKLVSETIFEADFEGCAYLYRPTRSAQDAACEVQRALCEGYTEMVDADLVKYFDTILHHELMQCLVHRIVDRRMLKPIKAWLKKVEKSYKLLCPPASLAKKTPSEG